MNPLAKELNRIIEKSNPYILEMLSETGKNLYFPKGILTQSAEAKEKAHLFDATIGIATEKGRTMFLPSVMDMIDGLEPEEALTYASSYGLMPLRKAWQESIFEKNPGLEGREISIPVVTNAITHALSVVSNVWVDPGDSIILPDKNWGNYALIYNVMRSADMVHYPMFNEDNGFNLEAFRKCIQAETEKRDKIIVLLNFPNNPTGYSITRSEGIGIAGILKETAAQGKNVVAIADDAYFGLFYEDDVLDESVFAMLTGQEPRLLAIKLDGATKENYVWGLRVGFVTYGACLNGNSRQVYDALERKTAGAVRGSISNAPHISQTIVLKSLKSDNYRSEKKEKFKILKDRASEVKKVLSDPKYYDAFEPYPFNSGYFMCIQLKTVEAEPLRIHLLEKYGVGLIALGKQDLRIAFSCTEKNDIRQLFEAVYQAVKDLE